MRKPALGLFQQVTQELENVAHTSKYFQSLHSDVLNKFSESE